MLRQDARFARRRNGTANKLSNFSKINNPVKKQLIKRAEKYLPRAYFFFYYKLKRTLEKVLFINYFNFIIENNIDYCGNRNKNNYGLKNIFYIIISNYFCKAIYKGS